LYFITPHFRERCISR